MRQALVNNLLVRMYHQGLEISIPQYARFKEIAQLAASKKQSLLILPCHKSHIVRMTFSLPNRRSLLMRFSALGLLEYAGSSSIASTAPLLGPPPPLLMYETDKQPG